MKKLSAVLLAVLMVLTCMVVPMTASAEVDYNALSDEEVINSVLDWVDTKIKEKWADFDAFEEAAGLAALAGFDVPQMEGINTLVQYKDYVKELGGDFADLDTSAIVDRSNGGVAFVNGLTQFMADNAAIFGKVFTWTPDGTPFDYGKVGEYIMGLEDGNEIKDFYVKYLKDGYDIQDTFIREIAREMGYEVPETRTETFDEILNNGIKNGAIGTLLKSLLKDASAIDGYDLRTTDVYTLVKNYIGLLQNDYKADIDTMAQSIFNALIPALKDVKNAVKDIELPVLTIGYTGNKEYATYTPSDPEIKNYMPNIYVNDQAKDVMDQYANEDLGIEVKKNSEMTEADAALVQTAAEAWGKDVIIDVDGVDSVLPDGITLPITIDLKAVEEATIAALQEAVDNQGLAMEGITATISDAKATFSYKAYKDDDSFAVQVKLESATAKANISGSYNGYAVNGTCDVDLVNPDATTVSGIVVNLPVVGNYDVSSIAQPIVVSAIKNVAGDMFKDPAFATVVVNNLSGSTGIDLESIKAMLSYIKDDAAYDTDLLDFFKDGRYGTYKGAVSQANRIVVDAAKMVLNDEGLAYFGISESNNIDTNIANIRTKANDLIEGAKDALNTLKDSQYAEYIPAGIDLNAIDLGVFEDIDLSSNEGLYVSMIKLAGNYIPAEMEEIAAILNTVKGYDTLDDMFVALINKCAADLTAKEDVAQLLAKIGYTYTNIPTGGNAKDNIMKEAATAISKAVAYAETTVNTKINEQLAKFDPDMQVSFKVGVAYDGSDWEGYFNNLINRFIDLTNGLFIAKFDKSKGVVAKAADIFYAVLPIESMFSNVKSGADLAKIDGYIFNDALNGNFANLLSLAEVKEDAIAGNVSVTKALINASERIVKAFFPTTVSAASYMTYEPATKVQEYFTSYANDPAIAARNMADINNRKADLIPFACNLLKESGLLPYFGAAHKTHTWDNGTVTTAATCKAEGVMTYTCKVCGETKAEAIAIDANNHTNVVEQGYVAPSCTKEGQTAAKVCKDCGKTITASTTIAKTAHSWGNWVVTKEATEDEEGSQTRTCSVCGATETQTIGKKSVNFFQRIINTIRGFFDRIVSWFRGIFSR